MLSLKVYMNARGECHAYAVLSDTDKRTGRVKYRGGALTSVAWGPSLRGVERVVGGVERVVEPAGRHVWGAEPVLRVPLGAHAAVVEALTGGGEVEIVPPEIVTALARPPPPPVPDDALRGKIGDELWGTLLPYQRDGVRFVVAQGGRGLIADEMGLGKTMQALGVLAHYREDRPAVIVCPAAVRASWKYHLRRYAGVEHPRVIRTHTDTFDEGGVTIMSFGMFGSAQFSAKVAAFAPRAVICDESHYVRNGRSARTKKTFAWCKKARRVVLLTGTPMNRPVELYTQIKCVNPTLFRRFFHYRRGQDSSGVLTAGGVPGVGGQLYYACRYCRPTTRMVRGIFTHEFRGAQNLEELHAVLKSRVMVRRTKAEVLRQLPPKSRETVVIDEWVQEVPLDFTNDREFMALVRDTAQRKVEYVVGYVRDILVPELRNDPALKVLLWGHHHFMLDAMVGAVKKAGLGTVCMDGRTTTHARSVGVAAFQSDAFVRVAVLGITAMGTGVTLTAGRLAVFSEVAFTPDVHLQAEDRIHRIGQEHPTCVRYLVCEGSTDTIVMRMLEGKLKNAGLAVDGRSRRLGCAVRGTAEIRSGRGMPNSKRRRRGEGTAEVDFSLL